jgi:hypothetical protein
MTRLMALVLGALAVSLIGCSTMQNTPKQDYTWAMWDNCNTRLTLGSGLKVDRVEPSGRYWTNVVMGPFESDIPVLHSCMQEQYKAHPYLDWLKARQASAPQSGTMPSPATTPNVTGPIMAPVWYVGDEWEYAYKSPSDSGTFVWFVNRIETLETVEHYVIKAGTREIFYRVSDLASSLERVNGVVAIRNSPSRLSFAWPLTVGKTWEQSFREERLVDRQTLDRDTLWTVEADETVTVLAGTFRTVRIAWRNKKSNVLLYEMWYAPHVKQWVKIREVLSGGIRERELLAYKLK